MKFVINILPKGQRRTRSAVRNGHVHVYKDTKQSAEERALFALLAPYKPSEPLAGPLLLGVKAYLPIPQSRPVKWRQAALNGVIRPTTKPDMDNIIKHIKDCLSVMQFWEDDRLVVGYLPGTGKYYSVQPRWEVEILEWRAENENCGWEKCLD